MEEHDTPKNTDDILIIGVITSARTMQRTIAVHNTWRPHFKSDVLYFAAGLNTTITIPDAAKGLPNVHPMLGTSIVKPTESLVILNIREENNHLILTKTVNALKYMYEKYPQKSWYMKCDDDTFVIPENLIERLKLYSPKEKLLLGRYLPHYDLVASGGAGYILSNALMAEFYHVIDGCLNSAKKGTGEDIFMARCMREKLGIAPTNLDGMYMSRPADVFGKWSINHKEGLLKKPLTFHWIEPNFMYEMEYLVYWMEKPEVSQTMK